MNRTFQLIVFAVAVVAQLYVPASMIFDLERTVEKGRQYKFRTQPIDPSDPFRGKYVRLNFRDDRVVKKEWLYLTTEMDLYVTLREDAEGFAVPDKLFTSKPDNGSDYLKVRYRYIINDSDTMRIAFPFDRFYMEESKALEAELAYRKSNRREASKTHALVSVWNGEGVITDVILDGRSIKEVARERLENKE